MTYLEWENTHVAGHAPRQRELIEQEGRAQLKRWYETDIMPGLLQTEAYARGVLIVCIATIRGADDLEDAVAARMQRQQVLDREDHEFHFVLAEWALWQTVGGNSVMIEQLEHLLDAMNNPRITLGVIPLIAEFRVPSTSFVIHDTERVLVETVSAELNITKPSEIALYERTFDVLVDQAEYGDDARALIGSVLQQRRSRIPE